MARRDIHRDFEKAVKAGGNPYMALVDDYDWTPDEVVLAFDLLDPYAGADANDDRDGIEFLSEFDLGSDGALGYSDAFDDPDDREDFLEDVREGDD